MTAGRNIEGKIFLNIKIVHKKRAMFFNMALEFFLGSLLLLFSLYLGNQRLKCTIERFFKRFRGSLYKKVVAGYMHSNLGDLVFNRVNYIIKF